MVRLPLCGLALREFVLRAGLEIAGVVPLVQLAGRVALQSIDHAPALDCGARSDGVGPALNMAIVLHLQELPTPVQQALGQRAVPGPDGDIRNRVGVAGHVFMVCQMAIEHIATMQQDYDHRGTSFATLGQGMQDLAARQQQAKEVAEDLEAVVAVVAVVVIRASVVPAETAATDTA